MRVSEYSRPPRARASATLVTMPPEPTPSARELFDRAVRVHQAGQLGEAERLYRRVLELDRRHADALHLLGVLHHQSGRHEPAIELIRQAIARNPQVAAFYNNLGNAQQALGRLDEAVAAYSRAVSLKRDHVQAHYNLGVTLQAQGELSRAAAAYGQALTHRPQHVEAHANLGTVLYEQGQLDEAIASYGRALQLQPGYAQAHGNLGNVLRAQGKLGQALAAYRRALELKPDFAEAHNNLGLALFEAGRPEEAAAAFEKALEFNPGFAAASANLANVLRDLGRNDEAIARYQRAIELQPDFADARMGLAMAAIPIYAGSIADSRDTPARFAQALDSLAAWVGSSVEKMGAAVGHHQPFYLAYRPADITALLCRYGDLAGAAAAARWQRDLKPARRARAAGARIRLAIVSGQVRHHPVWDIVLRGLIETIDRERFEIALYHTAAITDAQTAWARAHVEHFVQGPLTLRAWLDQLARHPADVIYYPEVGMDPATCALAALRLAPVQVAGWGHPVTTGLPQIDLYLSGELLEPPDAARHYREKLVRLPGTGVCTQRSDIAPAPWQAPDRKAGTVRFALCHQPIKFDPAHDALIVRVAREVKDSEFWLVAPTKHQWAAARLHDRLASAFREDGLDPDRQLRVAPWMAPGPFMGFLDQMDVYLDCPAFSGYTTAHQAIHRGLPIVTWEGAFLRQRLAAGLLRQIGITDGIAAGADDYVAIAVKAAQSSLEQSSWALRRQALQAAARRADQNNAAVRAFEQTLFEAVEANA